MISVLIGGGLGAFAWLFLQNAPPRMPIDRQSLAWGQFTGHCWAACFYYVSGGSSPASMNKSTANIKTYHGRPVDAGSGSIAFAGGGGLLRDVVWAMQKAVAHVG